MPLFAGSTPDVSVEINRFKADSSTFIELSVYIVGSSLECPSGQEQQYGVDYILVISGEDGTVAAGNRYRLSSKGCPAKDLIDIRRFRLIPGNYEVRIEMIDIMDTLNNITITEPFTISTVSHQTALSDIQLLSTLKSDPAGSTMLHKSGLYIEPLPFRYYYPAIDVLSLYLESYRTDSLEGRPYMQYTIKPAAGEIPPPIVAHRKVEKQPVSVNVFQYDIRTLISGNYILEASLYDGNKKLVDTRQLSFSRFNPKGDSLFIASGDLKLESSFVHALPEDSLDFILKAMAPVVNSIQMDIMNALLEKGSIKAKKYFIHKYWTEENGKFANQAFTGYMRVARVVDDMFRSGFGFGFETDRGFIFLKYGKPDDIITVEDEPSAPPYEIWFYNTFPATHQNNVRFLFYNPSLARNGHKLLHSTAIGETKNERWEIELYRDATQEIPGVNEKEMGDNVNRNARKYFEN